MPEVDETHYTIKKNGGRKRLAMMGGALVFLLIIGTQTTTLGKFLTFQETGEAVPVKESGQIFVVHSSEMITRLTVSGRLEPGKIVPVSSPFDGVIQEKHFQLGSTVEKGMLLLTMDAGEIESRLREAKSAWVRAKVAADTLSNWENGPEMSRTRRLHAASVGALEILTRKMTETKVLLDRGIVPRSEYEDLVHQLEGQKRSVADALLDLEETRKRGDQTQQELLSLELENARARLDDLETQRVGAKVLATASGILIRPPGETAGSANTAEHAAVEPGARLSRGTPLFMIADTSSLIVKARIDEMDVNRIRVGQTVMIDSDAFAGTTLQGEVISVSAEASASESGRSPSFDVRVHFEVPDNHLRKQIRVGMSARATILIYRNPKALIVPTEAVHRSNDTFTVVIRDSTTGKPRLASVVVGATNEQGVEILSGVSEGNELILDATAFPDPR